MILKGSQRAGGQDLAVHLMRLDENEHMELHELRGFAADDLKGAFKEAEGVSLGTQLPPVSLLTFLESPGRRAGAGRRLRRCDRADRRTAWS